MRAGDGLYESEEVVWLFALRSFSFQWNELIIRFKDIFRETEYTNTFTDGVQEHTAYDYKSCISILDDSVCTSFR